MNAQKYWMIECENENGSIVKLQKDYRTFYFTDEQRAYEVVRLIEEQNINAKVVPYKGIWDFTDKFDTEAYKIMQTREISNMADKMYDSPHSYPSEEEAYLATRRPYNEDYCMNCPHRKCIENGTYCTFNLPDEWFIPEGGKHVK